MSKTSLCDLDQFYKENPRRLTNFNMKMKRIEDLNTHREQNLLNKLFKYIISLRNL